MEVAAQMEEPEEAEDNDYEKAVIGFGKSFAPLRVHGKRNEDEKK